MEVQSGITGPKDADPLWREIQARLGHYEIVELPLLAPGPARVEVIEGPG